MSREEEIFGDALEVPVDARAEFLARACGEDGSLRERVQVLLEGHADAGRLLPGPLPPPGSLVSEQPGDVIGLPAFGSAKAGRYALVEKIGEGGCGVVWRAEQREPVKREVALKVIKLGMDTREVIARFEAERQALARMDHPNIARVFDGGATESGRPYFVMELVRGVPITRYCDEHALGLRERIELFIAVCEAVQHAHQKGIIHRDLKPSNILVADGCRGADLLRPSSGPEGAARPRPYRSTPVPKVIDFGIAKATQGRLTDATLHTAVHQFMGTPAYMSPEQVAGGNGDIDTRSDIYSLGVLLYELLTGETPLDRASLGSSTYDEIREKIRTLDPVRPSMRVRMRASGGAAVSQPPNGSANEIRRLRNHRSESTQGGSPERLAAQLRGDLDWIVMRCLEKDRSRRYDSASALAFDLARHLRHEPVQARPPSLGYVAGKLIRRHRMVFGAAAGIALVGMTGLVASMWQALRATRAEREQAALRQRAEVQELAARRRAYGADLRLLQQSLAVDKLGLARELLDRQRPRTGEPDLRGWEWRYLWQFCRSDAESMLFRKRGAVNWLSASPDGQWLAVNESAGESLWLWHLPTRMEIAVPRGPGFACSAFSPAAPLLAFATSDNSRSPAQPVVRLWHLTERRIVREMTLATVCARLAFARDGEILVTSGTGETNEIALWRVADGHKLAAHPAPTDGTRPSHTSFAVAPDLSVAALATIPATHIRLIDLATGATRWTVEAAQERVLSLAFSPDGRTLASGAGWVESTIRILDVDTGSELRRLEGQRSFTRELAFFADGRHLASVNGDQTVRVWDVADRRLVNTFRGHTDELFALALLPDQQTIVSGCKDGTVFLWDRTAARAEGAFSVLPKTVVAWAFAPDGNSVISLDAEGRVELRSGSRHAQRRLMLKLDGAELPSKPAQNLTTQWQHYQFAPDRPLLATGSSDGEVSVWDWERGTRVGHFRAPRGPASPKMFMRGGEVMMVKTGDRLAEWDWVRGRELRACTIPPDTSGIAFSPDSRRVVASRNAVGQVTVCEPSTGRNFQLTRTGHHPAYSPDGRLVAVCGPSNAVSLWDAQSFAEVARLAGFTIAAQSVVFSPDSSRLAAASGGLDGLKLWDVESRENVLTLEAEGSLFWQTAFSPDGSLLASSNMHSGLVHLWRAPSWAEIAAAEKAEAAR